MGFFFFFSSTQSENEGAPRNRKSVHSFQRRTCSTSTFLARAFTTTEGTAVFSPFHSAVSVVLSETSEIGRELAEGDLKRGAPIGTCCFEFFSRLEKNRGKKLKSKCSRKQAATPRSAATAASSTTRAGSSEDDGWGGVVAI